MFLREQQTFGAIGPLFSVLASSLIREGQQGRGGEGLCSGTTPRAEKSVWWGISYHTATATPTLKNQDPMTSASDGAVAGSDASQRGRDEGFFREHRDASADHLLTQLTHSFSENLTNSCPYGDLPTPVSGGFSSVAYANENFTNFGDLPTPADRSESVSSVILGGVESVFDGWDIADRYQIERIIGRGSYGEVVQAIDAQ